MEEIPKEQVLRLQAALARMEPAYAPANADMPHVKCSVCSAWFVRFNASTDACDMVYGPCACGGWHSGDHVCPQCKGGTR